MAVAKVAAGTGNRVTGASASLAVTATSPNLASSGADVCAVVAAQVSVSTNSTSTTLSATYGGVAMIGVGAILLGGSSTARAGVQLFTLFNPPTGTQNVVVTAGGTSTKDAISAQSVVFSGVGSVGARQTATATTHAPTSSTGGYNIRVLSNGAALSSPNQTDEYGAGSTVTGVGDYVRVQSAAGTGSTISFTCAGTATTPLSAAVALGPVYPALSTLVDTMDSAANWTLTGTAAVSGGTLNIPSGAAPSPNVATSTNKYNAVGSSMYLKVTHPTDGSSTTVIGLRQNDASDVNNQCGVILDTAIWLYRIIAGGAVEFSGVNIAYNATTHAWIRIRESAGSLILDVSPDGATWTNAIDTYSYSTLSLGGVTVAGYTERASGSHTMTVDNVNTTGVVAGPPVFGKRIVVSSAVVRAAYH